jgi:hypothetical protein
VSFVEKVLVPEGFQVKTNKKVFDENGRPIAEFDVEVSGRVGSTDFSWLIECRDRPATGSAPISWVEQLVGRKTRFNFGKVTAVSTTGFTSEAIRYAKQQGIETRSVNSISVDQFRPWLSTPHISWVNRTHKLTNVILVLDDNDEAFQEKVQTFLKQISGDTPALQSTSNGRSSTFKEAFLGAVQLQPNAWEGVQPNAAPRLIRLRVKYDNDLDHFVVEVDGIKQRVREILFEGELILEELQFPLQARRYLSGDRIDPIAEIAKFEGTSGEKRIWGEIRRLSDAEDMYIVVRVENSDRP